MKLLAHFKAHTLEEAPDLLSWLVDSNYIGEPERIITLTLEAYDWNCPQHLIPRFTQDMVDETIA